MEKYESESVKFLNTINLDECPGVKIGDVLGGGLKYFENRDALRQMKDVIRSIKKIICLKKFNYSIESQCENAKNLFISLGNRKDADNKMYAVVSCVDNAVMAREVEETNRYYKIRFDLIARWNKSLKIGIASLKKRLYCCMRLYWLWNYYDVLDKSINFENTSIENVIMPGEGYCVSVYLSERLKEKGFKIVGCQTVVLSRKNPRCFMDSFDVRLVWGNFTYDEAKALGVAVSDFIQVGMPLNILEEKDVPLSYGKKIVGLIVNGGKRKYNPIYEKEVDVLQRFCKKNNLELRIKLHPNYSKTDFEKADFEKGLDYGVVSGVFGREYDSQRFLDESDILIVNSSTMLIEAFSKWKPCFQFIDDEAVESTFYDYADVLKFKNVEELQKLYDSIDTENFKQEMKRIHDYFVGEGNTRENYLKAFAKCGVV